jgi:hypothetical protein
MSNIEVQINGPVGSSPSTTVEVGRDGQGRFSSTSGGPPAPQTVEVEPTARPARTMSDATRERIAALNSKPTAAATPTPAEKAPEPPADAAEPAEPPAEPDAATDGDVSAAESPDEVEVETTTDAPEKPAAAPAPPEWEAERAELAGVAARQRAIIERMEGEVAATKKASASELSARAKRIEDAEKLYLRDPAAAIKAFVASATSLAEDGDDLKAELSDVFIDLTTSLFGVTPDAAHTAKRTSALTRREWDRSKQREVGDKQQAEQPAAGAQEPQYDDEGGRSLVKQSFKSIADKYPHLTALTEYDGTSVEAVLWDVLKTGLKRGDFDPAEQDDVKLVAQAAKHAEEFYQRRAAKLPEKLRKALLSTATPGAPAEKQATTSAAATGETSKRQGNGRSLSNADASVAPAKTPTPVKTETERPKFKTDEERRRWATRHLRVE